MKTIKQAIKRGCKIRRRCYYEALAPDGLLYQLPYEAHLEYLYQWRKYPERNRK